MIRNIVFSSYLPVKIVRRIFKTILFFKEYFYYRFFYSTPSVSNFVRKNYLIAHGESLDEIARAYQQTYPLWLNSKIFEAEEICDHMFDILGSGPKELSSSSKGYNLIAWHMDIKSGHRWDPDTFYSKVQFGHKLGVDIKIPWELSRFQHLNTLGQAYVLTKNKKYAEEFRNQIEDWLQSNPVGFGVNWRCTMDVAIRVSNWLVAQEYFQASNLYPSEFWLKFYTSIYEHGKFIRSHLENKGLIRNNHYIADLVGLFFISVYCPFFKESKKWREFAVNELSKEIQEQIYFDGCNFEASTLYHRLVLELLFYAELLGIRAGMNFPQTYKAKVKKMFEFSLHCVKPDGKIPQIGDNDNGRFLIFSKRPILDHKYLLDFATIHYKDSQFKLPEFELDEEAFWLFGNLGRELYDKIPYRRNTIPSRSFPNAGWFIIRNDSDYCFISCGPNGQNGNGGHSHNDKLSFELMIDGNDIIVDPGTYTYTAYPKIRNRFRSTEYHNTLKCYGFEQNKIIDDRIFSLLQNTKILNADLLTTDHEIKFLGEIQYGDINQKREIIYNKETKNWKIKDSFASKNQEKVKLLFHLASGLTNSKNIILQEITNNRVASIEAKNHKLEKEIYEFSPEYGKKMEAVCLYYNDTINEIPKLITTLIGS